MKLTAVEWLLENLISEPYSEKDFEHNKNCWDKAELMEKEQIIDAYE
jgi:HD superfamily phosphodiesterase